MEEKRLLETLFRELFQTERSAQRHCRVEADRLGTTPPAAALRAVARDADAILQELPALARRHGLPVSGSGIAIGTLFSMVRVTIADHCLDAERSYRGTLLGARHGVDLVRLIRVTARSPQHRELTQWCDAWLARREPLVEEVAHQLVWWGQHPSRARQAAQKGVLSRNVQRVFGNASTARAPG